MNNEGNEENVHINNSREKQMHTIPSAYHIDAEIYHEPKIDNNDNGEDPITTRHDEVLEERDRIENDLKDKQSSRITLDIGGRHFATSRSTLLKENDSSFPKILLQEEKTHYFIDRDGAHFRYTLKY